MCVALWALYLCPLNRLREQAPKLLNRPNLHLCEITPKSDINIKKCFFLILFGGIVALRCFCLDHHRGVSALVVLRFVRNRPNDVTALQAECGTECSQGGDQHRDNDFDDLLFSHNGLGFSFDAAKVLQKNEPTKKVGSVSVTMSRFLRYVRS